MRETPRGKFLDFCRSLLDKYEDDILSNSRRLGLSCNSLEPSDVYRTDSPEYRRITQATFIQLWKKGLVYEDKRPNNYCTECGTTIADAEIEYREIQTSLSYIKFRIKGSGKEIVIATTRPELLCACGCILVHPDDERYAELSESIAMVPAYGREVPVIPNPAAQREFGTGAAMICSYGDYTDVRLFRELKLTPVEAIDNTGRMTAAAGDLRGLKVVEARKTIIAKLKEQGILVKQENTVHRTPVCWRSKTPIEFISMSELYLKQLDFIDKLRETVDNMKFYPPESKEILVSWINSVSVDWPISRRRFYGTEVPLWYCLKCGKPVTPPPGKYYQPWKDAFPASQCPHCAGKQGFRGEERTFDTWFDSGISELQIIRYLRDDDFFKKMFPCSIRPQGKDIVRTWCYYSILRTYQLLGKAAFERVWISGHVTDDKGEKMSKSRGNVTWPTPLLEKYGADALRLWGCLEAGLGSDIRYSEARLAGAHSFITKLWNISKFISSFPIPNEKECELLPADTWILGALNQTITETIKGYDELDFNKPATRMRTFTWDAFASHYLEMAKARAYNKGKPFPENQQKGAWHTLHTCLESILRILAPICPFITDEIHRRIYTPNKTIHTQAFPKPRPEAKPHDESLTQLIIAVNGAIWKTKKDAKLSLNAAVKSLHLPPELEPFKSDLKTMHNAENLNFKPPDDTSTAKYISANIGQEAQKKTVYILLQG
ncbi:MAG: valine--tRNA ligase [Promethearchaeati archaeon SRVP18_Atabeyarchaeia-1]